MLHLLQNKLLIIISLFIVVSMSGCVGGGASDGATNDVANNPSGSETTPPENNTPPPESLPPPNDSPGGVWIGSVTNIASGDSFESVALVTEPGVLRLITEDSTQLAGTVTVNEKTFTGEVTSYTPFGLVMFSKDEPPITGTTSGTINERSTFSGHVSVENTITSNFNYSYDPIYERDSSLSAISGNYSKSDGEGYTLTWSINATVLTGSDTNGCVLNGTVELLNTDFNMYRLQIRVTSCGELDGNYGGPASLFDEVTENDTLVFSLECVRFLMAGVISRT